MVSHKKSRDREKGSILRSFRQLRLPDHGFLYEGIWEVPPMEGKKATLNEKTAWKHLEWLMIRISAGRTGDYKSPFHKTLPGHLLLLVLPQRVQVKQPSSISRFSCSRWSLSNPTALAPCGTSSFVQVDERACPRAGTSSKCPPSETSAG